MTHKRAGLGQQCQHAPRPATAVHDIEHEIATVHDVLLINPIVWTRFEMVNPFIARLTIHGTDSGIVRVIFQRIHLNGIPFVCLKSFYLCSWLYDINGSTAQLTRFFSTRFDIHLYNFVN